MPQDSPAESVTLIYAIAANNLNNNLYSDMREMMAVARDINLNKNIVLVYSVNASNQCRLQKLAVDDKGNGVFELVRDYPETPLSTDPERISRVIEDVVTMYPDTQKGLVLWSHATAWVPWFPPMSSQSKRRSFGQDNYQGVRYECNITELAEAIPADTFRYIWFDCCYMGNIETIYQLRNKADYIVGYPTEISTEGMPYDLTLPYLAAPNPDLEEASVILFKYYDAANIAISVAVVETDGLETLAHASRPFYLSGRQPASLSIVNNYSRLNGYPLYDFEQLMLGYSDIGQEMTDYLKFAIDSCVKLSLVSDKGWNNVYFNHTNECGLSVSNFINKETAADNFYTGLDWYKATREE